jgi:hypothetical protein
MESASMTDYDDKAEILEILNLYGFALDAHQWQLFDLIFTDDVIAEFGPPAPPGKDSPNSSARLPSSTTAWTATSTR